MPRLNSKSQTDAGRKKVARASAAGEAHEVRCQAAGRTLAKLRLQSPTGARPRRRAGACSKAQARVPPPSAAGGAQRLRVLSVKHADAVGQGGEAPGDAPAACGAPGALPSAIEVRSTRARVGCEARPNKASAVPCDDQAGAAGHAVTAACDDDDEQAQSGDSCGAEGPPQAEPRREVRLAMTRSASCADARLVLAGSS